MALYHSLARRHVINIYRLLYDRDVPLGHIDTGVALGPIWCQYDLETHLNHILTFLLHPRKTPGAPVRQKKWCDENNNNIDCDIDQ